MLATILMFGLLAIIVALSNAFIIWMKIIVKGKGYPVSFWSHFDHLPHFEKIIEQEENLSTRRKYKLILYGFYLSVPSIIIVFILACILANNYLG